VSAESPLKLLSLTYEVTKVHRVAFAGASGTGKTTLASWIEAKYALPCNPVGSRTIAKEMGFSSAYDADAVGRRAEFQTRLVEGKMTWEAEHDEFVTDRTTFDNLAYSLMHDATAVSEAYFNLARQGLARYEYIVYCPASVFLDCKDDPARQSSTTYQVLYDAVLWGLLQRFKPPPVRLITLPFPRLDHRKDFLEALMRPS
jgi:AAA domain